MNDNKRAYNHTKETKKKQTINIKLLRCVYVFSHKMNAFYGQTDRHDKDQNGKKTSNS